MEDLSLRSTWSEKIVKIARSIGKGSPGNPQITLEALETYGTLRPLYTNPSILWSDEEFDVALLQAGGNNYTTISCSLTPLQGDEGQLEAIGWRKDRETYDKLGPGKLQAIDPVDQGRWRISFGSDSGNSGGPIFDQHGKVIGILTSGRDQVINPGLAYTFATMLSDVSRLKSTICLSPSAELSGFVRDASGRPLGANISVAWHGSTAGRREISASASDGKFNFTISPGQLGDAADLELHFAFNGFQDHDVVIGNDGQPLRAFIEVVLKRLTDPDFSDGFTADPVGRTLYLLPYTVSGKLATS